jgi:hypothetical protein
MEKEIKFKLIDNNTNSKEIRIMIICFLERNIPNTPIVNRNADKTE